MTSKSEKRECKHCSKPATMLISRSSPFSPQYPLCDECGDDRGICIYYAHEQFKYKSIEQFAMDSHYDMDAAIQSMKPCAMSSTGNK